MLLCDTGHTVSVQIESNIDPDKIIETLHSELVLRRLGAESPRDPFQKKTQTDTLKDIFLYICLPL